MSFYQVSSTDLHSSAEQLSELNQKLRSQKENLSMQESGLIGMWEGQARERFHQEFLKDIGQMEAFITVVDNYAKIMESTALRYDNAESINLGIAGNRTY